MRDRPEVLVNLGNVAIVALPGRRFPGCWVAADTLFTWFQSLSETGADDLQSEVDYVSGELRATLTAYVRQRRDVGEAVPFAWPEIDPQRDVHEHHGRDEDGTES